MTHHPSGMATTQPKQSAGSVAVQHQARHQVAHRVRGISLSCHLRVVTECHQLMESLHACRLVVAEGGEDVTIKVSDEGGGIPRSGMPRIWTYLYSTAKQPVEVDQVGG
jgi:hypothetical protein